MNRVAFLAGIGLGFSLAAARLNDYDVIHDMLLLREPDLFLLFAAALGTALPLLWLLEGRGWRTPFSGPLHLARAEVERKHVFGALVFGTGWAITGACPGTALAMPAVGTLPGIFVVAGLFAGQWLREVVSARGRRAARSSAVALAR